MNEYGTGIVERTPGDTARVLSLQDGWQTSIYSSWNFPERILQAWDRLAQNYGDPGVFLETGWFKEWWWARRQDGDLFIAVVEDQGEVRGIFPCWIQDGRLLPLADDVHYDFLLAPQDREKSLDCFIRVIRGLGLSAPAYLSNFPTASPVVKLFQERLRRHGIPVGSYSHPCAPYLDLQKTSWNEYVDGLHSKLKGNINRRRRQAEKNGPVEFEAVRETDSLDALLTDLFEVEFNSWKGAEGTAIKCSEVTETFYRGIARWAVARGRLYLFTLRFNGSAVAFAFCIAAGKSVFLLKSGYDESAARLSPGILLRYEMLRYLFGRGDVETFDFLGIWSETKRLWTSTGTEHTALEIYPPTISGWCAYLAKYGWKQPLKRSRRVIELVRRFRGTTKIQQPGH
jgi:CelD/BcsL family acetyltransferase involved in cellulose biosynthesis